jgi:hypothetical protein
VYGFIIVTAIHAALVYFHHAASPEIHQKINLGIAQGEVTTTAIAQATQMLDQNKAGLATSIAQGMANDSLRTLGIPLAVDPSIGFVPAMAEPAPIATTREEKTSLFGKVRGLFGGKKPPSPIAEQPAPDDEPWDVIKKDGPYALPCGHVRGCVNNWATGGFDCAVCGMTIDKGPAYDNPNGNVPYRVPSDQPMPDKSKQPKQEEPPAALPDRQYYYHCKRTTLRTAAMKDTCSVCHNPYGSRPEIKQEDGSQPPAPFPGS